MRGRGDDDSSGNPSLLQQSPRRPYRKCRQRHGVSGTCRQRHGAHAYAAGNSGSGFAPLSPPTSTSPASAVLSAALAKSGNNRAPLPASPTQRAAAAPAGPSGARVASSGNARNRRGPGAQRSSDASTASQVLSASLGNGARAGYDALQRGGNVSTALSQALSASLGTGLRSLASQGLATLFPEAGPAGPSGLGGEPVPAGAGSGVGSAFSAHVRSPCCLLPFLKTCIERASSFPSMPRHISCSQLLRFLFLPPLCVFVTLFSSILSIRCHGPLLQIFSLFFLSSTEFTPSVCFLFNSSLVVILREMGTLIHLLP